MSSDFDRDAQVVQDLERGLLDERAGPFTGLSRYRCHAVGDRAERRAPVSRSSTRSCTMWSPW